MPNPEKKFVIAVSFLFLGAVFGATVFSQTFRNLVFAATGGVLKIGVVSINTSSGLISGLTAPLSSSDASTRGYVDTSGVTKTNFWACYTNFSTASVYYGVWGIAGEGYNPSFGGTSFLTGGGTVGQGSTVVTTAGTITSLAWMTRSSGDKTGQYARVYKNGADSGLTCTAAQLGAGENSIWTCSATSPTVSVSVGDRISVAVGGRGGAQEDCVGLSFQ